MTDAAYPEVMTVTEAAEYLRGRLGGFAPSPESLSSASRPAARREARLPRGIRPRGKRKLLWLKSDLDDYMDEIVAEVSAEKSSQRRRQQDPAI